MIDQDSMKSDLLQDLIEQILSMKEGGGEAKGDVTDTAGMDDGQAIDDEPQDPKAKLSALGLGEESPEMPDAPEESDDEMAKPLSASDFMSMRKKHMGI